MLASSLKARLCEKKLTIGIFMTFDFWPGYLEIFKAEGMHFAVLDMEHGSASLRTAEEFCRTARLLDFPLLIRPEASVYHLLRRYLDMGPSGFMIPWTESQEQVEVLRDASFLPPKGRRGPGGPSIQANRSLDRAGWDEIEENLFMMLQIETPAGVKNLPSLLAHDWVDATMLGPYDLSLNLNRCGQCDHPEVVAAIQEVHSRSTQLGKPCGMVVGTVDQAKFWIDRGFTFLITGEVSYYVRQQSRTMVQGFQKIFATR